MTARKTIRESGGIVAIALPADKGETRLLASVRIGILTLQVEKFSSLAHEAMASR